MTLQDASKEFRVYPSVMRAWQKEGRMPPGSIDNFRVSRSALIAALDGKVPLPAPDSEKTGHCEVSLARRILEVCESPTPDNLISLAAEAKTILDRLG